MGTEDKLSGLISQLSDLIEDVAFVEYGPKFESKQAILMVRHKKFGVGKKGGKKASKEETATSSKTDSVASSDVEESSEETDSNDIDEVEEPFLSATPVYNANQSFDKKFDVGDDVKAATSSRDDRGSSSGVPSFNNPDIRQETENRYARSAAKNTSPMRNPNRFPVNGSHPQPPPLPPPRSQPRPSVPSPNAPHQRGGDGRQPPNTTNFGIFSNPNSGYTSDATRTPRPGNLNTPPPKSDAPQKSESADKKFGIFSR